MTRIKNMLLNPIIITIFSRLWLFIVAGLAVMYLPFRERVGFPSFRALPQYPFLDGWTRWDSSLYVSISTSGYFFSTDGHSNAAFFPLYPLTIRLLSVIFKDPYISGIVISFLSLFIGVIYFLKLMKEYILKDDNKIFWSIIFLLSYPYSFFFSAVYSESLFFLCAIMCFYFAERRNWLSSGIFGMLACADRFVGIALFPAIIIKYFESEVSLPARRRRASDPVFNTGEVFLWNPPLIPPTSRGDCMGSARPLIKDAGGFGSRHIAPLLFIGLIPLGLLGYMLFLYIKFGDPLAFAHSIEQGWKEMKTLKPDILLPFKSLFNTVVNFSQLPDNKYHVIFQFPILLFFLTMTFFVLKYLGLSYWIFSLLMILIPASVSINLIGMGRYLLVIFPVFVVIPIVIKNNYLRFTLLACSFFFLTLFTAMFATWWWVG